MAGLIVHEWFAKVGGSENVVREMMRAFPEARLHVLWNDAGDPFPGRQMTESWLARTPLRRSKKLALPFEPFTWRRTICSLERPDWLLVSSHLFAHHVHWAGDSAADVGKFVYVHTPARYIWEPDLDPRGRGAIARLGAIALRPLDARRAREESTIAANSEFVRERIWRCWDRDSRVLYPPVDTDAIISGGDWRDRLSGDGEEALFASLTAGFVLGASRLVGYKMLDRVMEFGEANGRPVVIVGDGPERERLEHKAHGLRVPVRFVGRVSTPALRALMQLASVFVFPPIEDFGILPVEAMACGTPAVVNKLGGARESVLKVGGGVVLSSWDPSSMKAAFDDALRIDHQGMAARSGCFSSERFRVEIQQWVEG